MGREIIQPLGVGTLVSPIEGLKLPIYQLSGFNAFVGTLVSPIEGLKLLHAFGVFATIIVSERL